eukprot:1160184-Pelagomonas_calceolata.AAC.5
MHTADFKVDCVSDMQQAGFCFCEVQQDRQALHHVADWGLMDGRLAQVWRTISAGVMDMFPSGVGATLSHGGLGGSWMAK